MPEQAQAQETGGHRYGQALDDDLARHDEDPDQAEGHVQAVGADQREKGRQESAAVRTGAGPHHAVKLADFQADESQAEQEGDEQPGQHPLLLAGFHRQRRQAEGDAAEQQQHGFGKGIRQAEQRVSGRPAGIVAGHHRVGREQQRKDDRVAHQVEPEAERSLLVHVRRRRFIAVSAGGSDECVSGHVRLSGSG